MTAQVPRVRSAKAKRASGDGRFWGKTMNKFAMALAFAAAVAASPGAVAQDRIGDATDMQALRAAVKADKRAYVASVLNLTDAEAKKFWPIYDDYQRTLDRANRERNLVIVDIVGTDKLTDAYAKYLLKDMLEADEAEIRARRKLQNKLVKALPAKKAARYLQLESKIRAAQAYDIAVAIPLVK
jgi:Spy/CpxP family protein refolding chaperone